VLDFDHLLEVVRSKSVQTIIHLAAVLFAAIKVNPRWATMVNADGILNVFEAARIESLSKVVWASSNAVFAAGPATNGPTANEAPHYPWGPYGAAKSFGERLSIFILRSTALILRPLDTAVSFLAPSRKEGIGHDHSEAMLKPAVGEAGVVPWGDDTVGWIYVDDAARAAVLACRHRRTKRGAFNIRGHLHPVREVVGFVKEIPA